MGNSQKYMAYIMPFFALSGLYWPFGLVLYWVTTNLWTLGQQYVLFTKFPAPAIPGTAGSGSTPVITTAKPSLRPGPGRGRRLDPPRPASRATLPGGRSADASRRARVPASPPAPAAPRPVTAGKSRQQSVGQAQGNGGQARSRAARRRATVGKPASASGKPAAGGKGLVAADGPVPPGHRPPAAAANGADNGSDGGGGMLQRASAGPFAEPQPACLRLSSSGTSRSGSHAASARDRPAAATRPGDGRRR